MNPTRDRLKDVSCLCRLTFDRSLCYIELHKYKEAEADITRALQLLPLNPTLLFFRANTLIHQKSFKFAAVDLEAATTIANDKLVYDALLWEGNKFLTKIAQPPELTGELWYHLGCMRAIAGDSFGSLLAFERAVSASPDRVLYIHELAKSQQVTVLVPFQFFRGFAYCTLVHSEDT